MATNRIQVGPSFVELKPGENYSLVVENTSAETIMITLEPSLFEVVAAEKQIRPVASSKIPQLDLSKLLSSDSQQFELAAQSSKTVKINFLQGQAGYFPGMIAHYRSKNDSSDSEIGLSGQIASVIIDNQLAEADWQEIKINFQLQPELGILPLNLNFGNIIKTETSLANQTTSKILKPNGGLISIFQKNPQLKLGDLTLTDHLPISIYPQQQEKIITQFVDQRPFWQRFGYQEFRQEIEINGRIAQTEVKILTIPWELLVICTIILAIIFWRLSRKKQGEKAKTAVKKR